MTDSIPYLILKYIHVLSAIGAVGANITYGVWSVRAQRERSHLGLTIKGIQFLDNRIANPAYGVLFLTGDPDGDHRRAWPPVVVVVAVILFMGHRGDRLRLLHPLVRNQIRLLDAGDTSSPEFERLARRNAIIGPILGLLVLVILAMMVFQPMFQIPAKSVASPGFRGAPISRHASNQHRERLYARPMIVL